MTARERLEIEVVKLGLRQLDFFVKRSLGEDRENLVIDDSLKTIVFKLFNELEAQDRKLIRFLLFLKEALKKTELTSAIKDYLDEVLGIPLPEEDPYSALVVYGEPFVDRQDLRIALSHLFDEDFSQVLVTRGPRYSGRSHCRWLIRHVSKTKGIEVVYVDLESSVEDIISQLINEMRLPVSDFRDRMAQATSQIKGFVSALKGYAKKFSIENERWCLIFDNHDRNEVLTGAREFVDLLIKNAIEKELPNVWIIVLGHGTVIKPDIAYKLLDVGTVPLETQDIENWLITNAKQTGESVTAVELTERKLSVLTNLQLPLDLDGMYAMSRKLRLFIN